MARETLIKEQCGPQTKIVAHPWSRISVWDAKILPKLSKNCPNLSICLGAFVSNFNVIIDVYGTLEQKVANETKP